MKTPKAFAALISSAVALCLAGGIAYAIEPENPTMQPAPEAAQDTSIAKQVASIIVYEDQEEAAAMATEFDEIHSDLVKAAVSQRAAQEKDSAGAAAAQQTADEAAQAAADVPAVDTANPLTTLSPEGAVEEEDLQANTIDVNGDAMGYVDSFETASAPSSGAGLWMGSDSTTDGSWGYFIGHNPGSFTCVMTLKNGDPVTVCDGDGNTRTYHVVDEFVVPDSTYWEDIQSRVTQYGESIILQTCCGDNAHYRVVIAD